MPVMAEVPRDIAMFGVVGGLIAAPVAGAILALRLRMLPGSAVLPAE